MSRLCNSSYKDGCLVLLLLSAQSLGIEATSLGSLRSSRQDLARQDVAFTVTRGSGSPAELEEEEESMEELTPEQASPAFVRPAILSQRKPSTLLVQSAVDEEQVTWPRPFVAKALKVTPQLPSTEQSSPRTKPHALVALKARSDQDRQHFQAARTNSSLNQAMPTNWPPEPDRPTDECNPPCLEGRGVCNDNICFCRSPYTGSTCQHNVENLFRVSYTITTVIAIACLFFGIFMAKLLTILVAGRRSSNALAGYGENKAKHELWQPPQATLRGGQ